MPGLKGSLLSCLAGKPATSTFIPPLVDSLLLDYQSPRAQLGFYPSEVPAASQRRRNLLQVAVPSPIYVILLRSWAPVCTHACIWTAQHGV